MDLGINNFDVVDKCLLIEDLFIKGDDIQKLSIIQSLPKLLQCDTVNVNKVVQKILQELPQASFEFHIATSQIFRVLIEKKIGINLLSTVVQYIEYKDQIVSNTWLETLLLIIPTLNEQQIKNDILSVAISKAQPTNSVYCRVASCRILGKVVVHHSIKVLDAKTIILPIVQSLCQDCSPDVRAAMCSQLHLVCQGLGEALIKTSLLPSLVELASDENMNVRSAAVTAVVLITPFLTKKTRIETIVPLAKQLCEKSVSSNDKTFLAISHQYGKLMSTLGRDLNSDQCWWFLKFYKTLCCKEGMNGDANMLVQCRDNCAANLPPLTSFTINYIPSKLDFWYNIFTDLANDSCYVVRKTVAGCLHEVLGILESNCSVVRTDIIKLIRDDTEDVLQMLIPHLGKILDCMCTYGILSRSETRQATLETASALLKCQAQITKGFNWRMQEVFFEQLECLVNCVPSDFIHQHFTSVLLNYILLLKAKPIRSQMSKTLLIFLRHNIRESQRKWIRDNLINILCYSKCCYTRNIYIKMCIHAMDIFSTTYFKNYFFTPLLRLAVDPISNIRLCFVNLLPDLHKMLLTSNDKKLKANFESVINKIVKNETDKDVLNVFQIKSKEMTSITQLSSGYIKRDKHKYDEEVAISMGKYIDRGVRKPQTSSTMDGLSQSKVALLRGAAGHKGSSSSSSDMHFLEQHFYIDAGISFPQEKQDISKPFDKITLNEITVSVENTDIEKMSESDLKKLQNSTTNITDDVKVNLRKINKTLTTTTKRHSSVYTATLKSNNKNLTNRRSLNIGDSSRIPICLNKSKSISENINYKNKKTTPVECISNENSIENMPIKNPTPKSSLPVLKRKTVETNRI